MDKRGKKPPRPEMKAEHEGMNVVSATETTGLFPAVPPPEVGAGALDQLAGLQNIIAPDTSDREIEDLLKD